jgi:hypothetical protein
MVRPPRAFDCYRRHICPNNTPNIISQMPIARARFTGIQFWKSAACVIYFQPRFSTLDPLTKCLISQSTLGLTFLDDCLCAVSRQNMFSLHAIAGASVTLFWLGPRPNPLLISRPIVGRGLWKRETTRTQKKSDVTLSALMLVGALHLFSCRVTSFTSRSKPAGASMRSRQIESAQAKMRKPLSRSLFNTTHARICSQVDPQMKWECARLHTYHLLCCLPMLLRDVTFVWCGRAPGESNY